MIRTGLMTPHDRALTERAIGWYRRFTGSSLLTKAVVQIFYSTIYSCQIVYRFAVNYFLKKMETPSDASGPLALMFVMWVWKTCPPLPPHCFLFSLLHHACCRVTQLLHQPLHIYKICKILHVKTLKTLRHVSVLRPSSGSYNFLAKVTIEIVTY